MEEDYPIPPSPSQLPDIDIEAELILPSDVGQERSTARRLALQILYEIDCTDHPPSVVIKEQLANYTLARLTTDYTLKLVNGVLEHMERVDMIIRTVAQEWPLDQVAIIDRNILRLGVCEHMLSELPIGVIVDEAVGLARQFGTEASLRFVNGVLGAVFADTERLKKMLSVEMPDDDDDDDYDDLDDD